MRALIIEPTGSRSALAATRALGQSGWAVGIASTNRGPLAPSSRWATKWHRLATPADDLGRFVDSVNGAIGQGGYEVVFGAGDVEVIALSAARSRIDARVPYASHDAVLRAFDKLYLVEAARRAGLAAPRTTTAENDDVPANGRPLIVKARTHASPDRQRLSPFPALAASNAAEALGHVELIRDFGGEPLLQEAIPGRLMAYSAVVDRHSRAIARVQQVAEVTWRPDVGVSARARTVPIDEALAEKSDALLADLGWFGLAQLQFIQPRHGDPVLIDVNGRFYGSLALATAAGVNLPALWACLATDRYLPPVRPAAVGVRYQWLEGDLRRAWVERRGGLAKDVFSCLRYAIGAEHSIARREDPSPAMHYTLHLAARALRKAAR